MARNAQNSDSIYRLTAASDALVIVDWDGVNAVYQRVSGETHVFNDVTVSFLYCLRAGSGTVGTIVNRLAAAFGAAEEEVHVENFVDAVVRLEELGLIERVDAGVSGA